MWDSTQLMSSGAIIGSIPATRTRPSAQNRHTTAKSVEYLLPRQTNIRRIFIDDTTSPVTFWAGNNHHAAILKIELLD